MSVSRVGAWRSRAGPERVGSRGKGVPREVAPATGPRSGDEQVAGAVERHGVDGSPDDRVVGVGPGLAGTRHAPP